MLLSLFYLFCLFLGLHEQNTLQCRNEKVICALFCVVSSCKFRSSAMQAQVNLLMVHHIFIGSAEGLVKRSWASSSCAISTCSRWWCKFFFSLFSAHVFDLSLVGSLFGRNLSYKLEMKYLAQITPSLHN